MDDLVVAYDYAAQLFAYCLVTNRKFLGPLFDGFADALFSAHKWLSFS